MGFSTGAEALDCCVFMARRNNSEEGGVPERLQVEKEL
jgi:hypothetical protein